jgi:uncharacterized membrane protein
VASACIAPGFEPLAKVALGIVLKRGQSIRRGLWATALGYAVIMTTAALTFFVLRAFDATSAAEFAKNPEVEHIAHPTAKEIAVSLAGAFAGAVIVSAYRRSVIVGALIALVIIPATAMVGVGFMAGRSDLAIAALSRLLIDFAFILGAGVIVFGAKKLLIHKRRPLD